jgi:hypothetical protein
LFNLVWSGVVKANEEFAYFVSSRTFVSPFEIMIIGAIVANLKLSQISVVCDKKWAVEHQRVNDYLSFPGYIVHGNMYEGALDFRHGTPNDILMIVYHPLLEILCFSLLFIAAYVAVKGGLLYLYFYRKHAKPCDTEGNGLHGLEHGEYHRLPIEVLLDQPIRAKCLMRNNLSMEILINRQRLIRPSCYLDHGLLPRDGNGEKHNDLARIKQMPRVSESDTTKLRTRSAARKER